MLKNLLLFFVIINNNFSENTIQLNSHKESIKKEIILINQLYFFTKYFLLKKYLIYYLFQYIIFFFIIHFFSLLFLILFNENTLNLKKIDQKDEFPVLINFSLKQNFIIFIFYSIISFINIKIQNILVLKNFSLYNNFWDNKITNQFNNFIKVLLNQKNKFLLKNSTTTILKKKIEYLESVKKLYGENFNKIIEEIETNNTILLSCYPCYNIFFDKKTIEKKFLFLNIGLSFVTFFLFFLPSKYFIWLILFAFIMLGFTCIISFISLKFNFDLFFYNNDGLNDNGQLFTNLFVDIIFHLRLMIFENIKMYDVSINPKLIKNNFEKINIIYNAQSQSYCLAIK